VPEKIHVAVMFRPYFFVEIDSVGNLRAMVQIFFMSLGALRPISPLKVLPQRSRSFLTGLFWGYPGFKYSCGAISGS